MAELPVRRIRRHFGYDCAQALPRSMMTPSLEQARSLLERLPLFADVPAPAVAELAERCTIEHRPKESTVFEQGDPCDRVWFVISGRVKIVFQDVDGRELILEMLQPGEAFGGAVLFFSHHPATARTAEASVLCSLSAETYTDFVAAHSRMAIKLLRMIGQRHLSMVKTQVMIGERVERRMAHILLKLADRAGCPDPDGTLITIPMSRQDLADMAGTTLESAIRTLSRFARGGLIHTDRGGYVVIRDRSRLAEIAQSG
jgi:CRP-like cAMP-binding protein